MNGTQEVGKICGVCGDKATVRNFGAIVCESCKCFFRRAVVRTEAFKCQYKDKDKCVINKKTRKLCKKCRLDKCYAIGMRKEIVLMKQKRKEEIEAVDPNKCHDNSNDSLDSGVLSEESLFEQDTLTEDDIFEGIETMEKFLIESEPKVTSSVLSIVRPIATFDKQLNEMEMSKLIELNQAADDFLDFVKHQSTKFFKLNNLNDLYSKMYPLDVFDMNLRSALKFCKGISKFREISQSDQMILYKSSCWRIIMMKKIPSFDPEQEHFTYSINEESTICYGLSSFKLVNEDMYKGYKNFWSYVSFEWLHDTTLIYMMMALLLFTCDSPDLTHKHAIKLNQQTYLYLIQRYLMQKYKLDETSEKTSHIMKIITYLPGLSDLSLSIFRQQDVPFSPLVKETLD